MSIILGPDGPLSVIERGNGRPLILLHGIQGTARTWDAVTAVLDRKWRTIAPNLRGRAGSVTPEDEDRYALDAYAGDLKAVLEWVGDPAVLVAWSMGVSVALQALAMVPDLNLRGLVLVSGTPCVGQEACWFHGTTVAAVAAEAQERAQRLGLVEAAAPHAVAASWQAVRKADFRPLLQYIAIPTLVIHGSDDDQCPISHGRHLAAQIPEAYLEEWTGVGHNPMADGAARFAVAVDAFGRSLP